MKKVFTFGLAFTMILALTVVATAAPQKTNEYIEAGYTYGAFADATVEKINGNQNGLTITVTMDDAIVAEDYFLIANNSAGEFQVGDYKVYVSTYGNNTIDQCFITKDVTRMESRTYIFPDTGEELTYWFYVSSKVRADVPAPFIVGLHGMGVHGNFQVGVLMNDAEEGGYIVVGPDGYGTSGGYGAQWLSGAETTARSEKDVIYVMDMMLENFNIDPERVYLMGHSMGGAGALFLGQKYVERWTAIGAIAPANMFINGQRGYYLGRINDAKVPLIFFAGGKDTIVPPAQNAAPWAVTMEQLGMTHEYIFQEGADHGSIITSALPDLFRFFEEHNTKPTP
jgi:poly(3-hydroxybutyrate) depolymerase